MALTETPGRQPTWDSVRLNDVLLRLCIRLEQASGMIANVEASLGILIHDARGLSPELIKDLQEIDLARQSICDVGRVLRLASSLNSSATVSSGAMASVIHLRDFAEQLLCEPSDQPVRRDTETDSISWL